jgi:hypothetical protein
MPLQHARRAWIADRTTQALRTETSIACSSNGRVRLLKPYVLAWWVLLSECIRKRARPFLPFATQTAVKHDSAMPTAETNPLPRCGGLYNDTGNAMRDCLAVGPSSIAIADPKERVNFRKPANAPNGPLSLSNSRPLMQARCFPHCSTSM